MRIAFSDEWELLASQRKMFCGNADNNIGDGQHYLNKAYYPYRYRHEGVLTADSGDNDNT
ncbi:MAG: hypothetical protein PVS3B3_17990 [Ktedonobacteraceae bacterium]